jgi:phenylacetate-CoA ligase
MQLEQRLKSLRLADIAIRRNPMFYPGARAQVEALQHADSAVRRNWTQARLAHTLADARRLVYGRRVHGSDDLTSWPILEQAMVRAEPRAFQRGPRLLTVKASTGGTSGSPLPIVRSIPSIAFEQACLDRMMTLLGVEPATARIAVLRGDNVKDPSDFRPPYWKFAGGGRRMVLSSNHLNARTVGLYAEALEQFRPDVLWAYPTSLESLCVALKTAGRPLQIPAALTSSEVLRSDAWRFITATLGCRLLDYYGQAERVAFAYAVEPDAYHFLPGYSLVELVPVEEQGASKLCEIVGTSLWNRAMPLVRYRTGDLVRVPSSWGRVELEEMALGLRKFAGVLGRDSDILLSPEGVRLTGIDHFQRAVPHLMRIQVVQESLMEVTIRVLATGEYSEADQAQLLRNVRTKLPVSMRVNIERVEHLERLASGKTPFVIHRPPVKALLRRPAASQAPGSADSPAPTPSISQA